MEFMWGETWFKSFMIEYLFTSNLFLHENQTLSRKSKHIPPQSCSDNWSDKSDIPLSNSSLRINLCNNNLTDELIENIICSNLDN